MFDCSNVVASGYFTESGLIRGNDDRGDGFGEVKRAINKQKRAKLGRPVDSAEHAETQPTTGGIRGNDEAPVAPPEQPVVNDKKEDPKPANDGSITLKPSELDALIAGKARDLAVDMNSDVLAEVQALRAEIVETKQETDIAKAEADKKVKAAQDETERLTRVLEVTGVSAGSTANAGSRSARSTAFNRLGSDDIPRGAAKDFIDAYNNRSYTPIKTVLDPQTGEMSEARDTRVIDEFTKKEAEHLRADMERYAKGHGLLRGSDASLAGNTVGTPGSIPDGFLPYLSSIIRLTHAPKFVWWQFQNIMLDLAQRPGQTILVPRFDYLDEPDSEANYILDTALASANLSTDNQALIAQTVPVEIKGYGLGLGSAVNNRPVAIPEFIMATSMLELQGALIRNLGHNYYGFEDFMIRLNYRQALFNPANIFYNVQGEVTNDATLVVDGADGTGTEEALASLWARMNDADIPTLPDGKRVGVCSTRFLNQFKNSLADKIQVPTESQLMEMTNILNRTYPGGEIDKVSQYFGCYEGFHLYETLSTSRGATPASEGVYSGDALPAGAGALDAVPPNTTSVGTTTTPPANTVFRDSFFFGPGAIGHGVSMPMEIRQDDANQFQTKNRFIWRSIEGWGALDVSSLDTAGAATNQQNRVYVLRTSDRVL